MGSKLLYYFILIPISRLPYLFIYLLSDFVFLILFKIIGYRKKVVFQNLKNSFPTKNDRELNSIMSKFYHHLCDVILESLKGFTISEKQLRKRLIIRNSNLINEIALNNKGVILVGGHINNWEICAQGVSLYSNHKCVAIYKPLSNKFFNSKIINSRSKYGLLLTPMKEARELFENSISDKAIIFGSDQSPSNPKNAYWMKFLNQDTGVLFGAEKYAVEHDLPVVYVRIFKMKRGFYEVEYELVTNESSKSKHGEITEKFTKMIEADIVKNPEYWLWSHKRWKHKKPQKNN